MIFPLLKTWLMPWFGTALGSSRKAYKTPSGFRTIGGGGDYSSSRGRRGPPSANPITANMTFNESEERIVADVKMQTMHVQAGQGAAPPPSRGIVVSNEVEVTVTAEERSVDGDKTHPQRIGEAW